MRIKKLEIFGFKSFADRVVIDFDIGVTGIVGPNGCGKSNVVDALRWVMGEQNVRHLRGDTMQDIIFNGSQMRGPLGMAEVVLTLENDGNMVAPEYANFSEIEVARRLYKTGDSEYEINKVPCRLRDITELFLGTGVGTRAYSIIEQGRISSIVQAKPEERRQIIEEAAGITKYKSRRQAAERKMESTQQNLMRINDVQREVEVRLNSLEKQAHRSEKYHQLQKEIRAIDMHHSVLRFLELNNRQNHLKIQQEGHTISADVHIMRIAELELVVASNRLDLSNEEKQLSLAQGMLYEAENAIALSKQDISFANLTLEQKQKQMIYINEETRRFEEKSRQLHQKKENNECELNLATKELSEIEINLEKNSSELQTLLQSRAQKAKLMQDAQTQFMESASITAKSDAEIQAIEHQRENAFTREKTLNEEKILLQKQLLDTQEKQNNLKTEIDQKQIELLEVQTDLSKCQEQLEICTENAKNLEEQKHKMAETCIAKQSRLKSLQEIEQSYDWGHDGLSRIMKDKKTGSILGLVADFFEAPADLEALVEEVLKNRLESVVVPGNAEIKFLTQELAQKQEGRIRFYMENDQATNSLNGWIQEIFLPPQSFFLLPKLSVLAHPNLINRVLGDIVVVEDMQNALDFWPTAIEKNITLISKSRELFETDGSIVSGSKSSNSGVLGRKREIRELASELETLQKQKAELEMDCLKHIEQRVLLAKNLEWIRARSQILAVSLIRLEETLTSAKNEHKRLCDREIQLEQNTVSIRQLLENSSSELEILQKTWQNAKAAYQELEKKVSGQNNIISTLDREIFEKNEHVTAFRIKLAALRERQTSLKRAQEQNLEQQEDTRRQMLNLANQLKQTVEDQNHLMTQKESAEIKIGVAQKERDILAQSLQEKRDLYETKLSQVRAQENTISGERKSLEHLKNLLNEIMLHLQESRLAEEALSNRLYERYKTKPHEIVVDYHLLPVPEFDSEKRLKDLHKSIDNLGAINPNAMEEFAELSKRHTFLKMQSQDLGTALSQLESAIKKINETTTQRFSESFHAINDKFSQVFPRLFKGGKAWLELTNPDDLLTSGVEVFAQPPGKKLGSIALMSGGEKALTATSLIFAIFLIKPSPFCLLDEVDAPLDEANVDRFSAMIKEISKISQFIVITHNKRTMEITDQLYGVTMEQPGISKTVHVKITQSTQAELGRVPEMI
jgi:chromosome segregation protein